MGINAKTARRLIKTLKEIEPHLKKTILTFGKQDIYLTEWDMFDLAGTPVYETGLLDNQLRRKPTLMARGYISDVAFFRWLGFTAVKSIDINPYEGANHIVDITNPDYQLIDYDIVLDVGTLEHVCDPWSALTSIYNATKTGGTIIHLRRYLPCICPC